MKNLSLADAVRLSKVLRRTSGSSPPSSGSTDTDFVRLRSSVFSKSCTTSASALLANALAASRFPLLAFFSSQGIGGVISVV